MRTDEELKSLATGWRQQRYCLRVAAGLEPNCCILTEIPAAPTDPVCLHPTEGCRVWAAIEALWRAGMAGGVHVDLRDLARPFACPMTERHAAQWFQRGVL